MYRTQFYQALRFLFVIGIIVFGFFAIIYLAKITYPFIIGFIIAFLINPIVSFLERKARIPRALAVIIGIIAIFAIFAGIVTWLIAEIVSGAEYLARVLPDYINTLVEYLEDFVAGQIIPLYNQLAHMFNTLDTGQQNTILENIQNIGKTLASSIGEFLQSFFGLIPNIIAGIPNVATVLIFSLLATFFISKDWNRLAKGAEKIFPNRAKKSGITVLNDLKKALFGFVKAQLTLISMTTIMILIGLLILRVNYAVTIALITGIIDLLPYLGTGLVFVPWIIYEIIVGKIRFAIGLAILYTLVLVQRQVMEPKVLSSNIGMNPLATLIALFVGYKVIGFLGLIVGPVTLVLITTLHRANVFRDIWNFIKGKESIIQ